MLISTANEIAGHRLVRHIGMVRGITVRSRSVLGNFAGGVQSFFGGKLSVYVELAERPPGRRRSTIWFSTRRPPARTP